MLLWPPGVSYRSALLRTTDKLILFKQIL